MTQDEEALVVGRAVLRYAELKRTAVLLDYERQQLAKALSAFGNALLTVDIDSINPDDVPELKERTQKLIAAWAENQSEMEMLRPVIITFLPEIGV